MTDPNTLMPVLLALIGMFSGTGFWAYRSELIKSRDKQYQTLLDRIDDLYNQRDSLTQEVHDLRSQVAHLTNILELYAGR